MDESKALTVRDTMDMATHFAKSKLFKDAADVAKAFVKIQAGQELGIPPVAAMSGIHVIEGKPSLGANLIAGRIKASGKYDYRIAKLDAKECAITFFEGGEPIGASTFTMEDAGKVQYKKDGKMQPLPTKYNWRQYPRNMLFARAISNGARWYCPDIFSGPVYTPDELGADVEIIDVTPKAVEPEPTEVRYDWIDTDKTRKAFWARCNELGLTDKEVYAAMGEDSMHKVPSLEEAGKRITAYLDEHSAPPDDHADEVEQEELL